MTHTNHLKIMVDEDFLDPRTLKCLSRLRALKVKTVIECGFAMGAKDTVLVQATGEEGLLLTGDKNTINERKYPPCTHGGILIIKHARPTPDEICRRVRAFCLSGHRAKAKNHVTHLHADKAIIYTHHKDPVTVTYKK